MGIIERMLKQTAVYWAPSDADEYGKRTYGSGEEVACRWEDKVTQAIRPDGSVVGSNALVFVGEDVEVGGMLALGETEDMEDIEDPVASGAQEIVSFAKVPDLKARKFLRTALLS